MNVYTYSSQREKREMLFNEILRDVLGRIDAAEEQFHGKGVEVAILQALLEQNEMLKTIGKKLDYIELCIEDLDEK